VITSALLAAALLAGAPEAGPPPAEPHVHRHVPPAPGPVAPEDVELARRLTLDLVLERVLARNPELAEVAERASARNARIQVAAQLPSPELQAQLWQQPLDRPWEVDRAGMVMLGVRQMLPAPGARDARTRAARAGAAAGQDLLESRRLDLTAQARRAFAAYAHAAREEEIHLQHVDLNQHIVSLARGRFEAGRMSKRDLLRTTFELSRLHADVANVQALGRASRALLNTLMARDPDAPLGPPVPPQRDDQPDLQALDGRLDARPDLRAAADRVAEREAALEAARREAGWPSLMVGADYGYMPVDGTHTYTLMVGGPLPWLWGGRQAEVTAAERDLAAERRALEAARRQGRFEVREAQARLESAREQFEILDGDLEPQARRGAEEAQAEFITGQGEAVSALEALHSLLSLRLQRSRALQLLEEAEADLDRAAGLHHPALPGAAP
jgi:outer membrane protein, heavy metal efflux system